MTARKRVIAMLVAIFMVLAMMPMVAQEVYAEPDQINMFSTDVYYMSSNKYMSYTFPDSYSEISSVDFEGEAIGKFDISGRTFKWNSYYDIEYAGSSGYFVVTLKNGKQYRSETISIVADINGDDFSDSFPDRTYTGKAITYFPADIDLGGAYYLKNDFASVTYSNNKNVGTATVKLKGKGELYGTATAKFNILPKGATIKAPKKGKKSFTAKWKRQKAKMSKRRITGYQVQYSTTSNFSSNVKNVYVKGYKKTSRKIKGLQKKTVYYVHVRTYMKVGSKYYYSTWSKTKAVKTK